ncbi:MAG: methylated-DNA--[protein]-cysteine S-methyltransferase [Alicyclobacillus herbarius]|uniref:methylated-DNA--[protein]-cysteine S-methyltransferase n=1 Tax=Alicyclobacillus herbarius TaxID=122960 RepID=UPI002353E194|nr:methylated-DNA--[protein]-cysteine S-methyltransferase [Alicyclobacillus herbarius]MCL6633216.1 methylated-DNA--[protein]-cysteine S-methyltransferase [Alicyclobacillus herbarius]
MMSVPITVYWDTLQYNTWTFHLGATDNGLCCITLPNERFDTLQEWVTKHVPGAGLIHDRTKMTLYLEQVQEYLSARRKVFSVPLDLRGTPFQVKVWRALLEIPFGKTQSYSQISSNIGHPIAVRAVGATIGANPIPIVVPCHRVIAKNGKLTGYRGGVEMKAKLLRLEGIS